ncbi:MULTISPECIES: hypothetical protein [unclassified Exiguobacterium]|nr:MULTISPECIES: hypothetical protein [unclassified Exiguobacterium]
MRELYKALSALGDLTTLFNKGVGAFAKRQVNKQAHKATAKAMRKFWG